MSKALEALKRIETTFSMNKQGKESVYREYTNSIYPYYEDFNLVLNALQRLEEIDNIKPSEAMESLEKLKGIEISAMPFKDDCGTQEVDLNDIRKVGSQLNTDFREYTDTIKQALIKAQEQEKVLKSGDLSDGYHTFNQLYYQRCILFASLVRLNKDKSWKSFKHSDGKYCFDKNGEWFIVGIDTPIGSYTYHYEKKYWDLFECQELECGKEWDGHTEEDVTRLLSLSNEQEKVNQIMVEKPLSLLALKLFKKYDKDGVLELNYQFFVDGYKTMTEDLDEDMKEQIATEEEFNLLKRYCYE